MAEMAFAEELSTEEQGLLDADQAAETEPVIEPAAPTTLEPTVDADAPTTPHDTSVDAPPTTVPLGKLQEERDKRQALEAQVGASNQTIAQMQAMMNQLMERLGGPAQAEPTAPPPNWDEDPDAYHRHMLEQLDRRLGQMETGQQQQTQAAQQTAGEQAFISQYQTAAQQFAAANPDFGEAYKHVVTTMDEELTRRGFYDQAERHQIAQAEERAIVQRAINAGRNPAEVIYEYAGYRGFKAPAPGPDKLATITKVQEAASPLPSGTGDAAAAVNINRLMEAEGEEFDKLFSEAQRKGLLG